MKSKLGLLILAMSMEVASAVENDTNRYTLPPSKAYIEVCAKQALLLHPGVIEQARMQHQQGYFWMVYQIKASDSSEWLVRCDLATGRIIHKQKLDDDAPQ